MLFNFIHVGQMSIPITFYFLGISYQEPLVAYLSSKATKNKGNQPFLCGTQARQEI